MKKTIIALLALSGIAMAAEYTGAITLPSQSTFWHRSNSGVAAGQGWSDNFRNTSIPAESVYKVFVAPEAATTGCLYYGCCNGVDSPGSGDVTITTNLDKSISFSTAARPANAGEYVALTLSMGTVLEPRRTAADELVSVTFSFTNNVAAGAYSAWGYTDGDDFVSPLADGAQATQSGKNSIVLTAEQLKDLNELVFVIGNDKNATQVTNLSVTATFVEKSVPEPTTGSLSLLALAGLCARRRKK